MLKRKSYKRWTLCFLSIFVIVTASVVTLNYAVDPMWCFNHETPYAEWREFIDERQQKTNLLRFRDFKIDTLIMGSSRVMAMDTALWGPCGFNFGVSSCMAFELPILMDIFYKTKGYHPNHVILGIDFFAAGRAYGDGSKNNKSKSVQLSLKSSRFISKLESLSSIELCRKSINLIIKNLENDIHYADVKYSSGHMDAHAFYPPVNDINVKKKIFTETYFGCKKTYSFFAFDNNYKDNLKYISKLSDTTKITPIILPEATPHLRLIAEIPNRLCDYEKMLRETVEVFGGVWNFMYVNSVTSEQALWRESSHCLSVVNTWIRDRVTGIGTPPEDFGVYVTKDNIDIHIKTVREQILSLVNQTDSWSVFLDTVTDDVYN